MDDTAQDHIPRQTLLGLGVSAVGLAMAVGAWMIPSEAGYAGIGPDFLPWVVSLALVVCGVMLVREARTGGFRAMEEMEPDVHPYWGGFAWMSAALLLNALLITRIGFILSCALCFVLAARGLRQASASGPLPRSSVLKDVLTGFAIAAPVYWMFTQFLAINLPGLTDTGWL